MPTRSFKQPLWIGMFTILIFVLVLSACGPASSPAASGASAPVGNQETASKSVTPALAGKPADPPQEYASEDFGFSLRYPAGYEVQQTFPHSLTFLAPPGTPGERVRGWMEVERALDQDALWFAEQENPANAGLTALQIYSSTRVIGGQQAYILGRMPGQDLSRQVFIMYKGLLYHLFFVPDDSQTGEAYQQMETLYAAVTSSLRFQPERRDVPPVTSFRNMVYQIERACETRSEDDITRLLGDEFIVVSWDPQTPDHYALAHVKRNDVARLMMDKYLSQAPDLVPEYPTDPSIHLGDPVLEAQHFPDQNVNLIAVNGWGPKGANGANLVIARRRDGSLFWSGMYLGEGLLAP